MDIVKVFMNKKATYGQLEAIYNDLNNGKYTKDQFIIDDNKADTTYKYPNYVVLILIHQLYGINPGTGPQPPTQVKPKRDKITNMVFMIKLRIILKAIKLNYCNWIASINTHGDSLLLYTIKTGLLTIADVLIRSKKCDIGHIDNAGNTVWQYLLKYEMEPHLILIMEMYDNDPLAKPPKTLLRDAIEIDMSAAAMECLTRPHFTTICTDFPNNGACYETGRTLLTLACENNNSDVALKLIDVLGDQCYPGAVDVSNHTALMVALGNKMEPVATKMLNKFGLACNIEHQIKNHRNEYVSAIGYAICNNYSKITYNIIKLLPIIVNDKYKRQCILVMLSKYAFNHNRVKTDTWITDYYLHKLVMQLYNNSFVVLHEDNITNVSRIVHLLTRKYSTLQSALNKSIYSDAYIRPAALSRAFAIDDIRLLVESYLWMPSVAVAAQRLADDTQAVVLI